MIQPHLHEFYREVARVALAAAGPYRFVLGGGVAWAAHGLVARPTEDVDLFADVEGAAAAASAGVRVALERAGFVVSDADPDSELAELFDGYEQDMKDFVVSRDGRQIRLSLARLDRQQSPVVMDLGPVMDVRDLVANKIAALVNRREVRDFIDVAAALDHYDVTELLVLARQVDPRWTRTTCAPPAVTWTGSPTSVSAGTAWAPPTSPRSGNASPPGHANQRATRTPPRATRTSHASGPREQAAPPAATPTSRTTTGRANKRRERATASGGQPARTPTRRRVTWSVGRP